MATFDWADWGSRVVALFPRRWAGINASGGSAFDVTGTAATNGRLGALIYGLASGVKATPSGLPFIWTQLQYAKAQCRMLTITDSNVDQVGLDWFGGVVPRIAGESDRAYASRLVLTQTAGCPSFPGLTKVLQAYLNALLLAPRAVAPLAADTSGSMDLLGGADNVLTAVQSIVQPLAADTQGAMDTWGFSDEPGPALIGPAVYIFDLQSDPAAAALLGLTWPQFCVALIYPGVNLNLLHQSTSASQIFTNMVQAFKAPSTIPIYASNGPN
ncbi:MAG: hypothetical protein JWO85_1624 [Candidatus Eremiobacteraeota bacterium]|nr:hypothetical protein [Candidatus Eremiobacteraeota bacterium]